MRRRLPVPIREMTADEYSAYQREYRQNHQKRMQVYERRYVAGRAGKCRDCKGVLKARDAVRCEPCWHVFQKARAQAHRADPAVIEAKRRYMREYMAKWRAMPTQERGEKARLRQLQALKKRPVAKVSCRFNQCEFFGQDHAHCECGEPMALDQPTCRLCIAEQPNVERVMSGKRWDGDGLREVAA